MYIPNHILPPECGVVSNNSNNNGTGSSSSNDNGNFDTLNTNTNTAYTHSTTIPNASLSNLLEMSNEIQINEIMDNITATKRSSTTTTTTTTTK